MTSGKRRRSRSDGRSDGRSSGRRRSFLERNRIPRSLVIAAGGILLVAIVAMVASSMVNRAAVQPRVAAAPDAVSIQLNAPFGPRSAGAMVADSDGLFRTAGVSVKLLPGKDDNDAISAVAEGRALVGVTDPISVLRARMKGQPVVAFAADYVETAIVFYALAKSAIRAPEDFMNKRVGRIAGTNAAILYDTMLNLRGISRSDVRETGENIDVAGLTAGVIDIIPGRIGEEALALRASGTAYTMIRPMDFGIHVPDLVYITTEKAIRESPSLLTRLLEGVIAGWTKAYADVPQTSRLIAEKSGGQLSAEQAAFQLAAQRDNVITVGRRIMEFDELQWKQLVRLLISARQIDEYFDLSKAVNYTLVRDAHRKPISFGNSVRSEPEPLLGR